MSFLTTDYSKVESVGYEALPTGEYEMIIASAKENATPNGAETLQIDLIVRNDVTNVPSLMATNGKYANRHVFMDNWKRKATHQYDLNGFMHILKSVGVPEGTSINSVDEFMELINRKPVNVYVKKEVDDYKTTDRDNPIYKNSVAPWNFSTTKFKDVNHQFNKGDNDQQQPTQQANNQPIVDDSDDSLPF